MAFWCLEYSRGLIRRSSINDDFVCVFLDIVLSSCFDAFPPAYMQFVYSCWASNTSFTFSRLTEPWASKLAHFILFSVKCSIQIDENLSIIGSTSSWLKISVRQLNRFKGGLTLYPSFLLL